MKRIWLASTLAIAVALVSAPVGSAVAGAQLVGGPATTSPSSSGPADDDIGPIPPDQLADIQGRAAGYRASLRNQQLTNATSATPDAVPFVGSANVWCTYSNPGSPNNYCNGYHPYPAVDLGMPAGTPVMAAGAGQVVALSTNCVPGVPSCGGNAGNYVAITHPDGRISRYMHLTSVGVAMGQNVVGGQQIGLSGWTGNVVPDTAATADLHYEEDSGSTGAAIDPGEMAGCRTGAPYGVLATAHAVNWQQVLWGTTITNDGSCGTPSVDPPPTGPTPPPWSTVFAFGGSSSSRVAAGINADGRQEVFVVGPFGFLFHSWQTSPNGFWSDWAALDTQVAFPASAAPTVMTNADGRLEVFVVGNDLALWHSYQVAPNSGWPGMTSLGGGLTANPSLARNADGRMEVFVRGTDGQMWHQWQAMPNSAWAGWFPLGGMWPAGTTLATPANRDGRLEVFGVGTDGQLWHAWQNVANGPFAPFESLGGTLPGGAALSATANADGRLDVFAQNGAGTVWHIVQSAAGGGWAGFAPLGGSWVSQPTAFRDQSGRINVAAMGTNGQLGIVVQSAANGSWRAPAFLGGSGSTKPTLNPNRDGHVEAYFTGSDAGIYHAWQMTPPT